MSKPDETQALIKKLRALTAELETAIASKDPVTFIDSTKKIQNLFYETSREIFTKLPLAMKIEDLGLSIRSQRCLERMQIDFVSELIQLNPDDLLDERNFGRKSLKEIEEKLAAIDLCLGMKVADFSGKCVGALNHTPQLVDTAKIIHSETKPTRRLYLNAHKPSRKTYAKLLRRVYELDLSVRPTKTLDQLKIVYIGDLVHVTEWELLQQKNLGKKSLHEIKKKLKAMNLSLGMNISGWPPRDVKKVRKQFTPLIAQQRRKELINARQHLQDKTKYLEDELHHHLASFAGDERSAAIIVKFYGWGGDGKKTLEAVGKEYSVTRERIRQICSKFERKIRNNPG